ncbi:sensor histidine kinase [Paraferrimonas haliotis]|uniref:sensor histidine kinase n=1 Tax=Paraferrimonas haliotis TaxID=2013866 RepID=UPI000BA932FA|nr:sensor histidine kinase [Paraferrimonas haliotis]
MLLTLLLLQQMCVYLVIAYLLSKTLLFKPLVEDSTRLPHKVIIYIVFSLFCVLGTFYGEQVNDAIANTRAMGAILGGLLGGPITGLAVGLTGGIHRYSLGGFTDVACAISTTLEGLLAGLLAAHLKRRGKSDLRFNAAIVIALGVTAEVIQMAVILMVAKPYEQALELVKVIALPMIVVNALGAALFMSIIRDRKTLVDKVSSVFSAQALTIAERSIGLFAKGFNQETSEKVARIIIEETKVGAVAITDREKLLAFIGQGADHHIPGSVITSQITYDAIRDNRVVFADGVNSPYCCSIDEKCPLGSSLVIPLGDTQTVIGTIKLYEPKKKLFLNINRTMGEGIARLLSNQILYGRYEQQKNLLVQSELNLLQAQVNPHFLFNALNTISAITRNDAESARQLLRDLAQFLRQNLKRNTPLVTLKEELQHIDSYLRIEKARFQEKLHVSIDIDPELEQAMMPTFTLQPLIENAVKHGTSQLLGVGNIKVSGYRQDNLLILEVVDNAGLYQGPREQGLGLKIVDKRLRAEFGQQAGIAVECQADQYTKVIVTLNYQEKVETR